MVNHQLVSLQGIFKPPELKKPHQHQTMSNLSGHIVIHIGNQILFVIFKFFLETMLFVTEYILTC